MNQTSGICNLQGMDLGERIAALRKRAGLNQSELGRALGLTAQSVQHWEKGGGIRPAKFEPLAKALGVSLSELLLGETPVIYSQPMRPDPQILLSAFEVIDGHLTGHDREFDMSLDAEMLCTVYKWSAEDGGRLSQAHLLELGRLLSPRTHGGSIHGAGGAGGASETVRSKS